MYLLYSLNRSMPAVRAARDMVLSLHDFGAGAQSHVQLWLETMGMEQLGCLKRREPPVTSQVSTIITKK
jgi:hypothetical protein